MEETGERKRHRLFGEIAVAEHFCTEEDVAEALVRQHMTGRFLGAIMLEMGFLEVWQVERVVAIQKAEEFG